MCRILIGGIHLVCIEYTETNLFAICSVFKGIAQTSCQFDLELFFSNESHDSNFLNERMGKTADVAYIYSLAVVLVVGILGNILVIISILRQKKLLKNNYYFLVLNLAICDLGPLIDNFPFHSYQLAFCRRSLRFFFHLLLCFLSNILRLSSRWSRYDVYHFTASLSCYCASFKT